MLLSNIAQVSNAAEILE